MYKEVTKKYIDKLGCDELFEIYDILICKECGITLSSDFDDDYLYDRYKKTIEYNFKCFRKYIKEYGDMDSWIIFKREYFRKQKLRKIFGRLKNNS